MKSLVKMIFVFTIILSISILILQVLVTLLNLVFNLLSWMMRFIGPDGMLDAFAKSIILVALLVLMYSLLKAAFGGLIAGLGIITSRALSSMTTKNFKNVASNTIKNIKTTARGVGALDTKDLVKMGKDYGKFQRARGTIGKGASAIDAISKASSVISTKGNDGKFLEKDAKKDLLNNLLGSVKGVNLGAAQGQKGKLLKEAAKTLYGEKNGFETGEELDREAKKLGVKGMLEGLSPEELGSRMQEIYGDNRVKDGLKDDSEGNWGEMLKQRSLELFGKDDNYEDSDEDALEGSRAILAERRKEAAALAGANPDNHDYESSPDVTRKSDEVSSSILESYESTHEETVSAAEQHRVPGLEVTRADFSISKTVDEMKNVSMVGSENQNSPISVIPSPEKMIAIASDSNAVVDIDHGVAHAQENIRAEELKDVIKSHPGSPASEEGAIDNDERRSYLNVDESGQAISSVSDEIISSGETLAQNGAMNGTVVSRAVTDSEDFSFVNIALDEEALKNLTHHIDGMESRSIFAKNHDIMTHQGDIDTDTLKEALMDLNIPLDNPSTGNPANSYEVGRQEPYEDAGRFNKAMLTGLIGGIASGTIDKNVELSNDSITKLNTGIKDALRQASGMSSAEAKSFFEDRSSELTNIVVNNNNPSYITNNNSSPESSNRSTAIDNDDISSILGEDDDHNDIQRSISEALHAKLTREMEEEEQVIAQNRNKGNQGRNTFNDGKI